MFKFILTIATAVYQGEGMKMASLNLRLLLAVLSFTASMQEGAFASEIGREDIDTEPLLRSQNDPFENEISRIFRQEVEALKLVFQNQEPLTFKKLSQLRFVHQKPFSELRGQVMAKSLGYNHDLNISPQTQKDFEALLEHLRD